MMSSNHHCQPKVKAVHCMSLYNPTLKLPALIPRQVEHSNSSLEIILVNKNRHSGTITFDYHMRLNNLTKSITKTNVIDEWSYTCIGSRINHIFTTRRSGFTF